MPFSAFPRTALCPKTLRCIPRSSGTRHCAAVSVYFFARRPKFCKKRDGSKDRLFHEVILSPEANPRQTYHSDLNATTGSRFAATDDGTSPAITVRQKLITIISSACSGLNTHSVSEPIFARFWMITLTIGCRM